MKLEIVHETSHWIAINKPSGLLVERNPYEKSVESILNETYPFIGIVHRLDRVTSGILLVAKKKSSLKVLNKQFSDRQVRKIYHAWVSQKPPKAKDRLVHYLYKDQFNKCALIAESPKQNYQKVILEYEVLVQKDQFFMLEIEPLTGKFHQIRAQLAFINSPILCDSKYNSIASKQHVKSIALRASNLCFVDPITDKKVSLSLDQNFRYNF